MAASGSCLTVVDVSCCGKSGFERSARRDLLAHAGDRSHLSIAAIAHGDRPHAATALARLPLVADAQVNASGWPEVQPGGRFR